MELALARSGLWVPAAPKLIRLEEWWKKLGRKLMLDGQFSPGQDIQMVDRGTQAPPAAAGGPISLVGTGTITSSTNIALTMSPVAGDTILVIYGVGSGSMTITGFTETANTNNPHILYKMSASGSEGANLTIASGTPRAAIALIFRNIDTAQVVEEVARVAGGNPPSITPSWGTGSASAFVALAYRAGATATVTTWPTDYTDTQFFDNYEYSAGAFSNMAAALRLATLASDDPSTYAFNPATIDAARTLVLKGL